MRINKPEQTLLTLEERKRSHDLYYSYDQIRQRASKGACLVPINFTGMTCHENDFCYCEVNSLFKKIDDLDSTLKNIIKAYSQGRIGELDCLIKDYEDKEN